MRAGATCNSTSRVASAKHGHGLRHVSARDTRKEASYLISRASTLEKSIGFMISILQATLNESAQLGTPLSYLAGGQGSARYVAILNLDRVLPKNILKSTCI